MRRERRARRARRARGPARPESPSRSVAGATNRLFCRLPSGSAPPRYESPACGSGGPFHLGLPDSGPTASRKLEDSSTRHADLEHDLTDSGDRGAPCTRARCAVRVRIAASRMPCRSRVANDAGPACKRRSWRLRTVRAHSRASRMPDVFADRLAAGTADLAERTVARVQPGGPRDRGTRMREREHENRRATGRARCDYPLVRRSRPPCEVERPVNPRTNGAGACATAGTGPRAWTPFPKRR